MTEKNFDVILLRRILDREYRLDWRRAYADKAFDYGESNNNN